MSPSFSTRRALGFSQGQPNYSVVAYRVSGWPRAAHPDLLILVRTVRLEWRTAGWRAAARSHFCALRPWNGSFPVKFRTPDAERYTSLRASSACRESVRL